MIARKSIPYEISEQKLEEIDCCIQVSKKSIAVLDQRQKCVFCIRLHKFLEMLLTSFEVVSYEQPT